MAEIRKIGTSATVSVALTLNEAEIRALDAVAGYGADKFIEIALRLQGQHYMHEHEAGLRSFLDVVRGCASLTKDAEECRAFLALEAADKIRVIREIRARA